MKSQYAEWTFDKNDSIVTAKNEKLKDTMNDVIIFVLKWWHEIKSTEKKGKQLFGWFL